jgi:hypothetical protein
VARILEGSSVLLYGKQWAIANHRVEINSRPPLFITGPESPRRPVATNYCTENSLRLFVTELRIVPITAQKTRYVF